MHRLDFSTRHSYALERVGDGPGIGSVEWRTQAICDSSSLNAYDHEVELTVLGITTYATVYFFADPEINKNVLGRIGWLNRVRLALVDRDSRVYLAPYDQDEVAT